MILQKYAYNYLRIYSIILLRKTKSYDTSNPVTLKRIPVLPSILNMIWLQY